MEREGVEVGEVHCKHAMHLVAAAADALSQPLLPQDLQDWDEGGGRLFSPSNRDGEEEREEDAIEEDEMEQGSSKYEIAGAKAGGEVEESWVEGKGVHQATWKVNRFSAWGDSVKAENVMLRESCSGGAAVGEQITNAAAEGLKADAQQ